jgi:hypothetical protein
LGYLHVEVTQAIYEIYQQCGQERKRLTSKAGTRLVVWLVIIVGVYFGRYVHGKHAVDAS